MNDNMRRLFIVLLWISVVGCFVQCASTYNNAIDEYEIIFNPEGKWSFSSTVAIDTNTFAISSYRLRIPFCETTKNGTIIVGADIREGTASDQTKISIGIVRSTDGGRSFSDAKIIIPHTEESDWDRAMDGTILVDSHTGRIFVFAHRVLTKVVWEQIHTMGDYGFSCQYVYSDDDGITWSEPKELRNVLTCNIPYIVSIFGGVGHGITMKDGTLVLPIQCKMAMDYNADVFNIQSGIIYSKDNGKTWTLSTTLVPCYSSENMVVEYKPGELMTNCKSYIGHRRVYVTPDMGDTWTAHETDSTLIEPYACQGTLHKIGNWGFFLNPNNSESRSNLTLQITDDFVRWKPVVELYPEKCFGYSCVCNNGKVIYAALEMNGEFITLHKVEND